MFTLFSNKNSFSKTVSCYCWVVCKYLCSGLFAIGNRFVNGRLENRAEISTCFLGEFNSEDLKNPWQGWQIVFRLRNSRKLNFQCKYRLDTIELIKCSKVRTIRTRASWTVQLLFLIYCSIIQCCAHIVQYMMLNNGES